MQLGSAQLRGCQERPRRRAFGIEGGSGGPLCAMAIVSR
jgi:hypothetical protein